MRDLTDIFFDTGPVRWIQRTIGLGHTLPFEILSLLGDTWGILLVIGIALWRYRAEAAYAVSAAAVVVAPLWLAVVTLLSVDRPSHPGLVVYDQLEAGSFPSGHVFHAVVSWGVLSALTRLPWWTAAVAGLATGLGRLYMGAHYPADVVASLALAPLFVWGFVALWRRIDWRRLRPSDRLGWILLGVYYVALIGALLGPVDPDRLRRWELAGIALAGPAAVVLRAQWDRARSPAGRGWTVAGVAGLAVLVLLSRTLGLRQPWLGAVFAGAALPWIFAILPALAGPRVPAGEASPPP